MTDYPPPDRPTTCPRCERFGGKLPGYIMGSNWAWVPCPHDHPTTTDTCPTCNGTKKLLSGEVFMCTDEWHLYRCHCGKPAVTTIADRPWCGDDR